MPIIFVNRDEALDKIEEVLKTHSHPYFHAGEVGDSLAFDHITDFSLDASMLFSKYQNGKIEFRTKSTNIPNLISIKNPPVNLIPAWTLSPERVANTIEHKTPSFRERLLAARMLQEAGFVVGARLDPIIKYEGWEKDYKHMIEELFSGLDTKRIDYVSLGTVKLHKLLVDTIRSRFPESPVILGEIVPAKDGKHRYIKFDRVDIYRKMISWIRKVDSSLRIELSMESNEVKSLVSD